MGYEYDGGMSSLRGELFIFYPKGKRRADGMDERGLPSVRQF